MTKYRTNLPQLNGDIFLTDGGLETTLIFKDGYELPEFAAFDLLKNKEGSDRLYKYFSTYAAIARDYNVGLILESATWRASLDWGEKIGYTKEDLAGVNHKAIELFQEVRHEYESEDSKMIISACLGPRGDGYNPGDTMSEAEAERYHTTQIRTFADTDADLVSAFTLNYTEEAIGIARAARLSDIPVVISFTVETDGKLPSGQTLKEAIEKVDKETEKTPVYYMINCAHPTHFSNALVPGESWVQRIRGIRGNASTKSHAELDESEELDDGNPVDLGLQYKALTSMLPHLNVLGGCCGTDHRHVEEIAKHVLFGN
jgi:S-methylmethionine-dependent homocysteine/selenocysteine methylase